MNRQERRRMAKGAGRDRAAQMELGLSRYRGGDLPGAAAVFRDVVAREPGNADALRLLGEVLAQGGQVGEALGLLRRAVAVRPGDFVLQYSLANALRMAGDYPGATAHYRECLALNPGFAGAHHGLGACFRAAQREREAMACFREAARLAPEWAVAWKDLGVTLAMLGEMGLAEAALARAAGMDPGLGDARRHLAAIRQGASAPGEIEALAAKVLDARVPAGERTEMLFALGQLEDKAGLYDDAFGHFAAGNALLRARRPVFDRAKLSRDVDALMAAFPAGGFSRFAGMGAESELPVFVVGMPRAGSTLFEQIAASHSAVFGAGELFAIAEMMRAVKQMPGPAWNAAGLAGAGEKYLSVLRGLGGAAVRVIDKMPDNIFNLGMIAAALPGARVVFCERDARDVAISCFFQNFAEPLGFDTDLADIAFRMAQVERLTRHWQQVLPVRWMAMNYEKLLAAPEEEARRLTGFLGVDWEPECLRFYESERAVRTASWSQVRQPLYQRSVGRWRHYAKQLAAVGLG